MVIVNCVIRTDASVEMGTGHVMRSLTLAKQLLREGVEVTFICREFLGNGISLIQNEGFKCITLPVYFKSNPWQWTMENWQLDAEETKEVIENLRKKIDLLIVDHYSIDIRWEKKLRKFVEHIMVIDDLANRQHDCDLLLDQNYYLNIEERYQGLVPEQCVQMLGPNYVLLRDEFLSIDPQKIKRDGNVNNVLVFFGGSDPTGETLKTLRAIHELNLRNIKFDIVVGAANLNKKEIKEICELIPNVAFHLQVTNMAELMLNADLSIGAGGTATWERCYLRLPSLTIIVADNQLEMSKAVHVKGVSLNMGMTNKVSVESIKYELLSLLNNKEQIIEMVNNCSNLINNHMVKRNPVIKLIMELCL